jgi:hypothetical protein
VATFLKLPPEFALIYTWGLYDPLEIIRQHSGRLLSVNPIKPSLEDLFLD